MKKILICGATGFIGKNITLGLAKNKNYKIQNSSISVFQNFFYETEIMIIY